MTLKEALTRIRELENENSRLTDENGRLTEKNTALARELEAYRSRNLGGRKKHNDAWMESYNDFAFKYANGMTIMEIVNEGAISRRTAYRYKAYFDEVRKMKE